jgi:hypothetical protein
MTFNCRWSNASNQSQASADRRASSPAVAPAVPPMRRRRFRSRSGEEGRVRAIATRLHRDGLPGVTGGRWPSAAEDAARQRQEADMAENPDETAAASAAESDEPRPDDRSGGDQSDGAVDPVTASPQEYPGKPGA